MYFTQIVVLTWLSSMHARDNQSPASFLPPHLIERYKNKKSCNTCIVARDIHVTTPPNQEPTINPQYPPIWVSRGILGIGHLDRQRKGLLNTCTIVHRDLEVAPMIGYSCQIPDTPLYGLVGG